MSFFDDASLVFLPSGQAGKDGKAYSMKPTNGDGDFTFSRGSNLTATRVDSNGLIEKGRENLLKQSNNFGDTSAWVQSQTTRSSGQEGYDGTSDAWEIVRASGGGLALYQMITNNSGVNTALSGVNTFSIYVKVNSSNGIGLAFASTSVMAQFDISDDSKTGAVVENGIIASTQEYVGNNFYRLSVTADTTASNVRLYTLSANGASVSVSGATYIVQDAQVEIGLALTEYIESGASTGKAGILEDSPRFDYTGGASCPSLLLEGSRTNEIGYSEYFEGWTPQGSPTITSNYGTSPEGLQNSSRLRYATEEDYIETSVTNTSGVFTIYAKGTGNLILTDSGANASSTTALTSSYQRIELYFSTNTTTLQIKTDSSGLDAEVYAAQFENATYPTSYIPNHSGGSVTREGDLAMTIPSAAFEWDGLASGDSATLFIETKVTAVQNNNFNILSQGGSGVWKWSTSTFFARTNNPATAPSFNMGVDINTLEGSTIKIAFVKDDRNLKMFYNGSSMGVVAISTAELDWCSHISSNYQSTQGLKQFVGFNTALTDAECITLTS